MANKRHTPSGRGEVAQEALQRFNLATMSGVFPGTRTQIYQRVQVQPVVDLPADQRAQRAWIQISWYDQPRHCVVYLLAADQQYGDDAATITPLLDLSPVAEPTPFNHQLRMALQDVGYQLRTCGNCRFWQPLGTTNPDQLPVGRCGWGTTDAGAEPIPILLVTQSHLALPCRHWQMADDDNAKPTAEATPVPLPMRRAAEEAEIRLSFMERLWRRFARRRQSRRQRARPHTEQSIDWTTILVERSGVGAGTEPCFACQGRIANLGALTVATEEDDKQTFSVWRCRNCYSLYLNNWVDRWERLDNLETEESYYRVAPAEARTLLAVIYGHSGGEHPNRRHERAVERRLFLDFIADRMPLSHQIRQGR